MLNDLQKYYYDLFNKSLEDGQLSLKVFYKDDYNDFRGIGKTHIINKLGLEYQALGYKVVVISPFSHVEYYADIQVIDPHITHVRGINLFQDTVVLCDEPFLNNELSDFIDWCQTFNTPVVGFVRGW